MSLKYFFVFVLCIATAYSAVISHRIDLIGDHTDQNVKKTDNGVEVSASAKNCPGKQTFTGTGKCWNFNLKSDGKKAKASSEGSTSHSVCQTWGKKQ